MTLLAAEYEFSTDFASQTATVVVKIDKPAKAFNMPAWAPGDYELFNYGQYVKSATFKLKGAEVSAKQEGPNRWVVEAGADTVTYTVGPSRGNFTPNLRIKENEYYASGPGVLGWFDGHAEESQVITLVSSNTWKAAISLPAKGVATLSGEDSAVTYRSFDARNYDELIDSPFVVGETVRTEEFKVEGKPHRIVAYNQVGNLDLKGFADMGAKIAKEAHRLFGEFGYDRYDFFMDFGGPGGGLEHLNSTRIGLSARSTPGGASGIMAHEYFHNFNVKRIRAKALGPFDYTKPGVTGTLWWLEGVTDYYAEVLLFRASLVSRTEFVDSMVQTIKATSQGKYLSVSADEASRRVWEARGSFGFGGVNYYSRGRAAGAVLDLAIRAHSAGKHSLDDVIRQLWDENKDNKPGYEDGRIRELCVKFGGAPLGDIYDGCVMRGGPFPMDKVLEPWKGMMGEAGFALPENTGFEQWPMDLRKG